MKKPRHTAITNKICGAPPYIIHQPDQVIHFVASVEEWKLCEERLREATVIGIDTEWRPVFYANSESNPCSLLQLAVCCIKGKFDVFVLDLLTLQPSLYNAALSELFTAKHIIKLGQGLLDDLKILVASYPTATCFSLVNAAVEVNDLSNLLAGPHYPISLQKLAYFYINKNLSKSMQVSNWDRRPLSESQLHYAASDALVLIDIFYELHHRLQVHSNGNFQIESVMNVLDVQAEVPPKCDLCYAVFETKWLLKNHKTNCSKLARKLNVCAICDRMVLLDDAALFVHTAACHQRWMELQLSPYDLWWHGKWKAREATMKNAKNAALSNKINSAPLYTIPHPDRVIHFVATTKDWPYCEERLREARVVGIDSETRPVFHAKAKSNPCSLLQLAVRCAKGKSEVFVLDLLKLEPKIYNAAISKLFLSKKVVKLGQGLLGDLKDLVASYPAASCFSVAKAVVEVNDLSISLAGSHHAISLQKLAYFYINKRLTKTMQTSNWNRRPLSSSQLHYAASDALVLIEIYDELLRRLHAHTNGKFKVESVMNVLDVHVEVTPKCTLCFAGFETIPLLKSHRRECTKTVLSLAVCPNCDEMLLLNAVAMEAHKTACGHVEDAENHSPADVSDLAIPSSVSKPKDQAMARKRAGSDIPVGTEASVQLASGAGLSKRARKKMKKTKDKLETTITRTTSKTPSPATTTRRRPPRKMSAGTLLAADDIWSEISMEVNSDQ